jgi:hypothetical protein
MTWDRQGLALRGEKKLRSQLAKLREQKTGNREHGTENREQGKLNKGQILNKQGNTISHTYKKLHT